ncbi:MAG TPA: HIRAN domain-containing protein [Candidatus Limnocylindrales bacterium]
MIEFEGRFYEGVSSSPNGRFTLAMTDSSPDGRVAGHRGGGQGAWVLFDGEPPVARGRLQRPNDGAVSDSGRFIVTDWLFTDLLESRFYAFEPDGRTILDVELGANAGDSAISADGRFAAVTTAGNPGRPEWSNLLLAYDLDRAAELWRLPVGRTLDVSLDGEHDLATLAMRGSDVKRTLRLSTGEPLGGWNEPLDKFDAIGMLEAEVKAAPDEPGAQESRIARARELVTEFADYPGWQARCLRVEGEALERLGRPNEAKTAYLRGLELDPHLGVRRRLAALGGEAPAAAKTASSSAFVDERPYASSACPSCGTTLDPLPKAKRKCPHCGEFIWVRGGPDGMRHLLKEDELEANELAWVQASEAAKRAQEEAGERQRALDRAAGLLVGLYQPEVVGESFYQEAIRRHVPNPDTGREGISVILELVPEPSNKYDRNAVAVHIDGATVGHIDRDEAPLVGAMLRKLGGGQGLRCRGTIRGGADYPFGVAIDGIPDAYEFEAPSDAR